MFNLFKKKTKESVDQNISSIDNAKTLFKKSFWSECKKESIDVPEINDDILDAVLEKFFSMGVYKDAYDYIYDFPREYIPDTYESINWDLGRPDVESTPEYLNWKRGYAVQSVVYDCARNTKLYEMWVEIHGKAHTDEEAAIIAAHKWGELLFDFHLQDNGALNEEPSFAAGMLATYVAEKYKEKITDDVKLKTLDLLKGFYEHKLHYDKTYDIKDVEWFQKNIPDPEGNYSWKYIGDPSCDYDPNYPLYLILLNGGVEEKVIRNICPWKTGINIRVIDNMVMYRTYGNVEEL